MPLNKLIYLDAFSPTELLRITGNGKPYFCDGDPIKFEKNIVSKTAIKPPKKTTKKFKSQIRYREAINEKPIILWIEIAQKQNRSVQDQFLSIGLTETISQFTKSNFSLLGITNSF